jgi:hypothetical protein
MRQGRADTSLDPPRSLKDLDEVSANGMASVGVGVTLRRVREEFEHAREHEIEDVESEADDSEWLADRLQMLKNLSFDVSATGLKHFHTMGCGPRRLTTETRSISTRSSSTSCPTTTKHRSGIWAATYGFLFGWRANFQVVESGSLHEAEAHVIRSCTAFAFAPRADHVA